MKIKLGNLIFARDKEIFITGRSIYLCHNKKTKVYYADYNLFKLILDIFKDFKNYKHLIG